MTCVSVAMGQIICAITTKAAPRRSNSRRACAMARGATFIRATTRAPAVRPSQKAPWLPIQTPIMHRRSEGPPAAGSCVPR